MPTQAYLQVCALGDKDFPRVEMMPLSPMFSAMSHDEWNAKVDAQIHAAKQRLEQFSSGYLLMIAGANGQSLQD